MSEKLATEGWAMARQEMERAEERLMRLHGEDEFAMVRAEDAVGLLLTARAERDEARAEVERLKRDLGEARERLRFSVPEKATAACTECYCNFKIDAREFYEAMRAGVYVVCPACEWVEEGDES